MRAVAASFLAVSLVLGASGALGDEPSAADPSRPTHWYGYQTLATDGVALLLLLPALSSSAHDLQTASAVASLATYSLGAPIVHLTHGHVGKAVADLGIRAAMPFVVGLLGGLIGAAAYQPSTSCATAGACAERGNWFGPLMAFIEGGAIGGTVGIGGAVAIDAALLAYEPLGHHASDHPQPEPPMQWSAMRIEPTLGVVPERQGGARATFGMMGTF